MFEEASRSLYCRSILTQRAHDDVIPTLYVETGPLTAVREVVPRIKLMLLGFYGYGDLALVLPSEHFTQAADAIRFLRI